MSCRMVASICGGMVLVAAACYPCAAGENASNPAVVDQTSILDLIPSVVPTSQDSSLPPLPPPGTSISKSKRSRFEHNPGMAEVLHHQWTPEPKLPGELEGLGRNSAYQNPEKAAVTLKQALYIAIRNNPGLRAEILEPAAALESVRQANAAFDPYLDSELKAGKEAVPAITNYSAVGQEVYARKEYDWNFGVSKLLATTNGTVSLGMDNSRLISNARVWMVNPSYNPELTFSLSQPLLRHFGLDFATINVRLSESGHVRAQYTFEQQLSDFVLETATDYWNVVRGIENLQVSKGAVALAQNAAELDHARLKMGMAARIDQQESQAALESWIAALASAEHDLSVAQARLRQQVMLNPHDALLSEVIQPADAPNSDMSVNVDETSALDLALQDRPELGALREEIREQLLQVRFAENQTLPELNLVARFGIGAVSGTDRCVAVSSAVNLGNCSARTLSGPRLGTQVPLGGTYADALNRLWNAGFYSYAIGLALRVPISNDYANATLAQARIGAKQARLRYRQQVSDVVVDVETSLSDVRTSAERARATRSAADYARAALEAETARYRAGTADTHELLQYQQELITALANQVQAQLDFEIAKLKLAHAEGTLLRSFQINFVADTVHKVPWYARF